MKRYWYYQFLDTPNDAIKFHFAYCYSLLVHLDEDLECAVLLGLPECLVRLFNIGEFEF